MLRVQSLANRLRSCGAKSIDIDDIIRVIAAVVVHLCKIAFELLNVRLPPDRLLTLLLLEDLDWQSLSAQSPDERVSGDGSGWEDE